MGMYDFGCLKFSQALASCSYFEYFLEEVVEGIEYKDAQLPLTVALAGLQQGNL